MQTLLVLRIFLTSFALLAPTLAWAQPSPTPLLLKPLRPLTPSKRGVVFPASEARGFGAQCSRLSPQGQWTSALPSKTEIARLERALPAWIRAQRPRLAKSRWAGEFNAYLYQYGALVRGKERFIYVNAMPSSINSDRDPKERTLWRRTAEVVCDGGPDFWGIEWNTRTGKFENFSTNGMA